MARKIGVLTALRSGLPEVVERPAPGASLSYTIVPVASGQHFGPGEVLFPGDECDRAWKAFKAGPETWQLYLREIEPQMTLAAFQKLSSLEVPEPPDNVVRLRQELKVTDDVA